MVSNEAVIVHTEVPGLVIKLTKPEKSGAEVYNSAELSFLQNGETVYDLYLDGYETDAPDFLWEVFNGFKRDKDGKSWVDPYEHGKELEEG